MLTRWFRKPPSGFDVEQVLDEASGWMARGQHEKACEVVEAALIRAPENARLHGRRGTLRHAQGDLTGAIESYSTAWRLDTDYAEMPYNIGLAEGASGHPEAAVLAYQEALRIRPQFLEARFNLACVLHENDRLSEACDAYRDVLAQQPDHEDARLGLGLALQEQRRLEEADEQFDALLALNPQHAAANLYRSFSLLVRGDWGAGWDRFAHRWATPEMSPYRRRYPQPEWDGSDPAGLTILVYPEQGFGDMLQFARFATRLSSLGAKVILEAPAPLARLLSTLQGVQVIASGAPLPEFHAHIAVMDLARHLGRDNDSIALRNGYLSADPAQARRWKERLEADGRYRVGIAWAGEPRPDQPSAARIDRRRSLRFEQLAPLARLESVRWISLQLGTPAEQARRGPAVLALTDAAPELGDFADTAALIQALDLVIAVDTSVVHLAGALGRPVWVLSRFDGCWRWLLSGSASPWYPSARVYRQEAPGDWASVLERVAADLETIVRLRPGHL